MKEQTRPKRGHLCVYLSTRLKARGLVTPERLVKDSQRQHETHGSSESGENLETGSARGDNANEES